MGIAFPADLRRWTFDTVEEIVQTHEFESGEFDYKAVLRGTGQGRDDIPKSIRRTVCALANAFGGVILFGVKDRRQNVTLPNERIIGISLGGDLVHDFAQIVDPDLRPSVRYEAIPRPIKLPNDPKRGVFVVRVPESVLRPHMVTSEGIFYRRGDGGDAVRMDYYEVREQMLFGAERIRKLRLLRLEIAQYKYLITLMRGEPSAVTQMLARFDTSAFKILLADVAGLLPDDDLLKHLLEIPLVARLVNEFLGQTTYPGMQFAVRGTDQNQSYREAILGNLETLNSLCDRCEGQLAQMFGPLTAGGGPG